MTSGRHHQPRFNLAGQREPKLGPLRAAFDEALTPYKERIDTSPQPSIEAEREGML